MSLSSDEINFLIYRYLRESGFEHSAFAFGHEALVYKSASIESHSVPPGALISFVQKGLQYADIEQHITDDGTELICEEPVSVVRKHTCKIKSKKRIFDPNTSIETDYGNAEIAPECIQQLKGGGFSMISTVSWNQLDNLLVCGSIDGSIVIFDMNAPVNSSTHTPFKRGCALLKIIPATFKENSAHNKIQEEEEEEREINDSMNAAAVLADSSSNSNHDMMMMSSSSSSSSSSSNSVSSGSDGRSSKRQKTNTSTQQTHNHGNVNGIIGGIGISAPTFYNNNNPPNKAIVCIEWNSAGSLFASGSYDGSVSIFSKSGDILHRVPALPGPITSVRWNPSGNLLGVSSGSGNVVIFSPEKNGTLYTLTPHTTACIDLDWRNDHVIASSASDGDIYIHTLPPATPHSSPSSSSSSSSSSSPSLVRLSGHSSDVNMIRWDWTGSYLASVSDDRVVRIWSGATNTCLHEFRDHTREVGVLAWCGGGSHTAPLLATGGQDHAIRLWDAASGKLVATLSRQLHPITALTYNSHFHLLAAASHHRAYIWNCSDGSLVRTWSSGSEGGINDLAWDVAPPKPKTPSESSHSETSGCGTRLFAAYSDGNNYVLHIKL